LPPTDAASLHSAFIVDVLNRHERKGRKVTLWRGGDCRHPFWARLDVPQRDQPDGNLGDRMRFALRETMRSADNARVVILGTDSPSLPPQFVDRAFSALNDVPLVIGPACDGGYYLVAMRESIAPIFPGEMPWGGETVLSTTLRIANEHEIPYVLLDFWYDIDRPADLEFLRTHLQALSAAQIPLPQHTLACLEAWELADG